MAEDPEVLHSRLLEAESRAAEMERRYDQLTIALRDKMAEIPVPERGGYSAGGRTVSELPPPPPSMTVQPQAEGRERVMTEISVSLVTDEMVTRAYAAFMQNVTAVTPKPAKGGGIHPRTAIRKALEAALDSPDLDGAAAILHREPDGSLSARIAGQKR